MRIHRSLRFSVVTLAALGVIAALVVALDSLWIQHRLGARATEAFVAKDVVADILPPPMYLIELRLVLSQVVEGTLDPAAARRDFDRLVGEYGQRVKYWTEHPPYGLERKLLGRQHEAAQKFIDAARTNVMTKVAAADLAGAREALAGIHALYAQHRAGVDETVSAGNAFADRSLSALDTTQSESRWTLLAVTAVTLAVIVVAGRFVLSCVESPVERCTASARRIAAGDLTPGEAVDPRRQDAVGRLEQALAQMREQFARMVNDVRLGAEAVASSSVQIAHGNADLSARTERQASALQQTASSMTELDSSARLNAENARQASSLAGSASGTAEHGGEVIAQVVATIRGINESSRRIADIIGTIDAIAFQTNILALNAAVEAARAGDQGRGFAVVAEEVRALAHRSAHAAKEIKTLISGSVERVEQGTTLVEQSLATMEQVVSAIRRTTALISEISSASAEQSSGVAQIGQAITQMDQDTQHNAALVEQSAAAAQSLKSQAEQLLQAASRFKLSVAAITSDAPGLRA